MNALANDQIKRLRQLLARAPHITFGRYVGDTPHTAREAAEKFAVLNPGEPRLPNELLSRAEMREAPPHILLTNYAMAGTGASWSSTRPMSTTGPRQPNSPCCSAGSAIGSLKGDRYAALPLARPWATRPAR